MLMISVMSLLCRVVPLSVVILCCSGVVLETAAFSMGWFLPFKRTCASSMAKAQKEAVCGVLQHLDGFVAYSVQLRGSINGRVSDLLKMSRELAASAPGTEDERVRFSNFNKTVEDVNVLSKGLSSKAYEDEQYIADAKESIERYACENADGEAYKSSNPLECTYGKGESTVEGMVEALKIYKSSRAPGSWTFAWELHHIIKKMEILNKTAAQVFAACDSAASAAQNVRNAGKVRDVKMMTACHLGKQFSELGAFFQALEDISKHILSTASELGERAKSLEESEEIRSESQAAYESATEAGQEVAKVLSELYASVAAVGKDMLSNAGPSMGEIKNEFSRCARKGTEEDSVTLVTAVDKILSEYSDIKAWRREVEEVWEKSVTELQTLLTQCAGMGDEMCKSSLVTFGNLMEDIGGTVQHIEILLISALETISAAEKAINAASRDV
ncbi:hypothetical protein TRVL_05927 [Trypanosoma vivax]|nr:hypothetical protein TRVL_05927 [Trypanosoma vivax]